MIIERISCCASIVDAPRHFFAELLGAFDPFDLRGDEAPAFDGLRAAVNRRIAPRRAPGPEALPAGHRSAGSSVQGARWNQVVDLLADTPDLDADRLYQAQRHAENKRWLLSHFRLLGIGAIIALMPDRFGADRNAPRVLDQLRTDGTLPSATVGRDWSGHRLRR